MAYLLTTLEQLAEVRLFKRHMDDALRAFPGLVGRRLIHETVRRMIDTLVTDLIETSAARIREHAPATVEDVREAPPLIAFSPEIDEEQLELKGFAGVQPAYRLSSPVSG